MFYQKKVLLGVSDLKLIREGKSLRSVSLKLVTDSKDWRPPSKITIQWWSVVLKLKCMKNTTANSQVCCGMSLLASSYQLS